MNSKKYKDLYAFHPGYYVNQLIEELEITQEEFALRMGVSAKTISLLVRGETDLSEDMALKLSNMFGMSIDVWLNLQKEYSKKVLEIEKEQVLDQQKEIASLIDYSFFTKLGILPPTSNILEKIQNLCSYFKVSNLTTLKRFCRSFPDASVNGADDEFNFYLTGDICNYWLRLITRKGDYNMYLNFYSSDPMEKYFNYLEQLRKTGATNMYDAARYLQEEFFELRFDARKAKEILVAWMNSYEEDDA